jgi:hypothetical protein
VLHVVLARGLGVCDALLGTPALGASPFGGSVALLLTVGVLAAVVAAPAVVLDRAARPGAAGPSGAVVDGIAVGVLGRATVLRAGLGTSTRCCRWGCGSPDDATD